MTNQIPNTGSTITMGKVYDAYTSSTITMGKVCDAYTSATPPSGYPPISLNGTLGSKIGIASGATTSLSASFGGRTTPYPYQ